jgi:hypothetical protein
LQKANIQYAARDALAGAIVGEQVYNISSDYKKTPPSIEEMQKCVVVRLLVKNRNTVSAIGKIHQVTQTRDYEARKSCTEVKVKVELIPKPSAFQLLPQNKRLGRILEEYNQGDIIVWRHSRIRLGTEYELAYLTTKQSDSAQEDRSAQRNQEPEANETTNHILGPITLAGDRRFIVNVEDDDVAPFLPDHSTINDFPEAHEIDNDVNPNDLGSHNFVIVSHDADGAVSVDEIAIAAPCGCPGRSNAGVAGETGNALEMLRFARNGLKLDPFHFIYAHLRTLLKNTEFT